MAFYLITSFTVYNDLTHPPATFVSNKYAYRQPDGGYNNVTLPDLGRAGTPYSRSVQQIHPLPAHMLPDPGLLFDTLLKREKVSSVLLYLFIYPFLIGFAVRASSGWTFQFDVRLGRTGHPFGISHVT